MSVAEEILRIYAAGGAGSYFGERVTMLEHGLQSAHFARLERASDALVLAALLHDIGHLLDAPPEAISDWRHDACHEQSGARWLAEHFGAAVSEPVRLHVAAKRYLCATEESYFARLSPASVHTLQLQGGPMSAAEVTHFERERFAQEAVRVRRWDDDGKVAGLETAGLADYVPLINRAARPR
jgi:[1-hydroxy-2-(trimethylamino)ethyl]phosphonate dioxygenase